MKPEPDLLTPLEPPRQDVERPVGTLRGDVWALAAALEGVEMWCGPLLGWRRLDTPYDGAATTHLIVYRGHAIGGLGFDLGPADFLRKIADEDEESVE